MPLCSRYRYRSEHRCCIWYLFFYFTHHRIANVYLAKIIIYSQTTRCGQCEEVTCSSDSHWSLFIYSSFLFPWRTRAYMIIRWIYNSIWWCVLYITVAKKKNISFIMASWAGSIEQTKKNVAKQRRLAGHRPNETVFNEEIIDRASIGNKLRLCTLDRRT